VVAGQENAWTPAFPSWRWLVLSRMDIAVGHKPIWASSCTAPRTAQPRMAGASTASN
jgi:hypothetical protein